MTGDVAGDWTGVDYLILLIGILVALCGLVTLLFSVTSAYASTVARSADRPGHIGQSVLWLALSAVLFTAAVAVIMLLR